MSSLLGRSKPRAALALTIALATIAPPARAAGEPAAETTPLSDAYKQHMANGVKLYGDGNFAAAIVEFQAAYAERPRASPLVNLALAHKSLFQYPQAIAALELALRKHADTMEPEDKAAAESAIAEMRALIGYVKVELSPPHAVLLVDDEPQAPGTADKPIPLGPGRHRIGARAEGYEDAEEIVTITSKEQDKVVKLALVPNKGWVVVKTGDPEMAIAIDQVPLALGQWAGLVEPGTHLVQMYRQGGPEYAFQVLVVAGKAQEVRPDVGGVPIAVPRSLPTAPPPPTKIAKPPEPPLRGAYANATGGVFLMLGEEGAGGMVGARLGYRISTPIGLEFLFDYANNPIATKSGDSTVRLNSARFGGGVRLMSPGRKARFVATIGGGLAYNWLGSGESPGGVAFINLDTGFELDWSGVLVGLAAQQTLLLGGTDTADVELADPRVTVGIGARVGFGGW
ncbi:hypothetical protein [Polyangium sp. 6x1]|uniref:hypothetical protein n=1 Tax=Polyangium sp. 6x1 TaxID=3042689 RepID=UPI002482F9F7|nr:hypothetical protein [Polyangium sp. 6x1]MDI1448942.1 hypothetical protein [Polyangium sp. 6x1]